MKYTPGYYPIQKIWDRDWKTARDNFGRKRKSTGYIYLPGSRFGEAEGHLNMRSCLQDTVINSAPRIGKYINKLEFYRKCLHKRVKDKKITDIENTSRVRSVMKVTPVAIIEREYWGEASILRIVNGGVYICTCSVRSDEYKCMKKHEFVYKSHFKPLHQSKYCVAFIDNRSDAPLCVMQVNDR